MKSSSFISESFTDKEFRNRERNAGLESEDNGTYSIWTQGSKDPAPKCITTKQCSMNDAERHAQNIKKKYPFLKVWWQAHHLGKGGFFPVNESAEGGLNSKEDFLNKREHLHNQLNVPGLNKEDRDVIRKRLQQLEAEAKSKGLAEGIDLSKLTQSNSTVDAPVPQLKKKEKVKPAVKKAVKPVATGGGAKLASGLGEGKTSGILEGIQKVDENCSASFAGVPATGSGKNVGTLFGGTYSQNGPFSKKKKKKTK